VREMVRRALDGTKHENREGVGTTRERWGK
jgi:hypothetical protein